MNVLVSESYLIQAKTLQQKGNVIITMKYNNKNNNNNNEKKHSSS